jgi:hypothetical protein
MSLFEDGHWTEARPLLQQIVADGGPPEAHTALGICELIMSAPWEATERQEDIFNLLQHDSGTEQHDAIACQAWLELCRQRQTATEQILPALDWLAGSCLHATWFPVWALALRALTYYDERQKLAGLLPTLRAAVLERKSQGLAWGGLALVLHEMQLECGSAKDDDLLHDLDPQNCRPLASQVASLWKRWLLAEHIWLRSQDAAACELLLNGIDDFGGETLLPDDTYSKREWDHISYLAALLMTRIAIAQRNVASAQQWLDTAAQFHAADWETHYVAGILAWLQADMPAALSRLEASRVSNPFQSRVFFELRLLAHQLHLATDLPWSNNARPVHDMLASGAAILYEHGEEDNARQILEGLDRPEAPCSLRLVWPQARQARVCQGHELAAHLAAANGDWLGAQRSWRNARQTSPHGPSQQSVEKRAYQLTLMARTLRNFRQAPEDRAGRTRYVEFQRGLASLSNRDTVTGDALFYRSLASEQALPAAALGDWLSLARDSEWLEIKRRSAPAYLLCLASRLWSAKRIREARRVYTRAGAPALAPDRWVYCELATRVPLLADDMLKVLDSPAAMALPSVHSFLLRSLCQLARTPPDCDLAEAALERASQDGLAESWGQVVHALIGVARRQSAKDQAPPQLNGNEPVKLPDRLQIGVEMVFRPQGLHSLLCFEQRYGAGWVEWCPVAPCDLLGWELQQACARVDGATALEIVDSARAIGLSVPARWISHVSAICAIQSALQGDFATATHMVQQALTWHESAQNEQISNE